MGPILFLLLLGFIGWLGKNTSLLIAAIFLLVIKFTPLDSKVFPFLEGKGNQFGRYHYNDCGVSPYC